MALLVFCILMVVYDIIQRGLVQEGFQKEHTELGVQVQEGTHALQNEALIRRKAEEQLRLAGKVIKNLSQGVAILDAEFRVTSINPAYTKITGYSDDDILGKPPLFNAALKENPELYAELRDTIKKHGRWEGELWCAHKNGEVIALHLSVLTLKDGAGRIMHYVSVLSDISRRKKDEKRIYHQANFDFLTGLPNRSLFLDRLKQAIDSTGRIDLKLGLIFLDLDGFKLVNDTLGHDIGDLLLKEVARRMNDCVRSRAVSTNVESF